MQRNKYQFSTDGLIGFICKLFFLLNKLECMKSNLRRKILSLLILYVISLQVYSQSVELKNSFNNINTILQEYNIEPPEVSGSRCPEPTLVAKKIIFSFQYPNAYISYNITLAPNVASHWGDKLGKRVISFPILDTKIRLGYKATNYQHLYFHSDIGIEGTKLGKKELLESWDLIMSPLVCKKLYDELNRFKFLVKMSGFRGVLRGQQASSPNSAGTRSSNNIVVKLQKEQGGIYTIPCKVNGLPLKFVFDTGASSVSISQSEAIFMLKNGYLSINDIVGSQQFQTASGAVLEGTKIIIKKIEIGGLILRNVEASVVHSTNAPLLLGQSVLSRLGKISIDYQKSSLIISR